MDGAFEFRWLRSSLSAYVRQPSSLAPLLTPSSYYCASLAKMRSSFCGAGLQSFMHAQVFCNVCLYHVRADRQERSPRMVLSHASGGRAW